jgi:signal transduction histidine kinase
MRVVIEHAAAERGILFLTENEGPRPVAEAHLGTDGIDVIMCEADSDDVEFSRSVLNYVVRTRTSVNSTEPANKDLLSGDPYLQQSRDVGLHCMPIVSKTKLVGVLYLESHIAVGAFTPQRAAVLDLLAAQAAISLENARLYADLQRSEASLVEGESISHTGSWSWNANTGKVIWSNEHYRIFGMEPVGRGAPTLSHVFRMVHPEDRTALLRIVRSSVRNRNTFTREYRVVRPDGVRNLQVVGRPSAEGYIGTTVDLSDYRQTQEALHAAQADLARASRLTAIGELTSLIAHEVRQPLTAIVNNASVCQSSLAHKPPSIDEAVAAVKEMEVYAYRASATMESIRQMTRKATPAWSVLDVNEAINETVALLGSEIRRQRVLLKADLASSLPSVRGDGVQLQQVIMNLMMNGMESMAAVDDRPRLLTLSTKADPSGDVLVAVSDAGVGLPANDLERLFEAFFTTKKNGLGVGLAISRSIIEAHGGRLWGTENSPYGAVFRFTVPDDGAGPT